MTTAPTGPTTAFSEEALVLAAHPGWDRCDIGYWEPDPERADERTTRRTAYAPGLFGSWTIDYEPVVLRYYRRRVTLTRTVRGHRQARLTGVAAGSYDADPLPREVMWTVDYRPDRVEAMGYWERHARAVPDHL